MAVEEAIEFHKGEDITIEDTIRDDSGAVVDITGYALTCTIRRNPQSPVLITKTVAGGGITIPVGTDGVLNVAIPDDDTNLLVPSVYSWDVKRMDAGSEAVLTYGKLTVKPPVTD